MTSLLSLLMARHDAALAAYDAASNEDFSKSDDPTGNAVDALRDAILDHRPTLAEVATKAAFMTRSKTFTVWDNFDPAKLITALTPVDPEVKPPGTGGKAVSADLKKLISRFVSARTAWQAADPDCDCDSSLWNDYEAAEHAVIVHPCRTLEEVRMKARFFLENEEPYDTIRNCRRENEETLLPFLRSLIGEVA